MAARGTIRTIIVRNVDMAASVGNGVAIPVPSRRGSPYYEVVGLRITVVSGTTGSGVGCTFNLTSDTGGNYGITGGNGNLFTLNNEPLNMTGGTPGETKTYSINASLGQSGGQGGGDVIWTAGWLQSSPVIFFRCTGFVGFCTIVADIQIDIRDIGQVSAPVISDNIMAKIRCANTLAVQVKRVRVALGLLYVLAPNWVTREGVTKNNIVIYDLTTGLASAFNFTSAGGSVNDFDVDTGNGDVYIVGTFTSINGTGRNRAAALDLSGTLKAWNPNVSGDRLGLGSTTANRIRFIGGVLYFAGNFTTVGATTRNMAAAFDTAGVVTSWNPNLNGTGAFSFSVNAVVPYGSNIILGGNILTVGGTGRLALAMVDSATGTLQSWAPSVGSPAAGAQVLDVATDQVDVWVFGSLLGPPRSLAKFDASGAVVAGFAPPALLSNVSAIAVDNNNLIMSNVSIVNKTTGALVSPSLPVTLAIGAVFPSHALGFLFVGNLANAFGITMERYTSP
jgi:hypothetical protein